MGPATTDPNGQIRDLLHLAQGCGIIVSLQSVREVAYTYLGLQVKQGAMGATHLCPPVAADSLLIFE